MSIVLTLIAGIAVLAVWRGPLTTAKGWTTVAVRLLISPLTYLQVRAERRRAALAPELAELREKHSDDPATLAAETIDRAAVEQVAGLAQGARRAQHPP